MFATCKKIILNVIYYFRTFISINRKPHSIYIIKYEHNAKFHQNNSFYVAGLGILRTELDIGGEVFTLHAPDACLWGSL